MSIETKREMTDLKGQELSVLTRRSVSVGEGAIRRINNIGVVHLPVPSKAALKDFVCIRHVVVPVIIATSRRAHRRIGNSIIRGKNGHKGLTLVACATQSSIESVVELVVRIAVKVHGPQLGEALLIRAHRVQVGDNLVLESQSILLSSLEGSRLVTRDLEVL